MHRSAPFEVGKINRRDSRGKLSGKRLIMSAWDLSVGETQIRANQL